MLGLLHSRTPGLEPKNGGGLGLYSVPSWRRPWRPRRPCGPPSRPGRRRHCFGGEKGGGRESVSAEGEGRKRARAREGRAPRRASLSLSLSSREHAALARPLNASLPQPAPRPGLAPPEIKAGRAAEGRPGGGGPRHAASTRARKKKKKDNAPLPPLRRGQAVLLRLLGLARPGGGPGAVDLTLVAAGHGCFEGLREWSGERRPGVVFSSELSRPARELLLTFFSSGPIHAPHSLPGRCPARHAPRVLRERLPRVHTPRTHHRARAGERGAARETRGKRTDL